MTVFIKGQDAFSFAFKQFTDTVYRVALHNTSNFSDAEDVTQEVFIKLLETNRAFRDSEHLKAWLIRVTINTAKDMLKSYERKNLPICEDILYNQIDESQKTANSVLEYVFNLEEKYRIIIHLYYYEEYSLKEIASILQLPLATVGTRLSRGRKILKTMLKGEFDL